MWRRLVVLTGIAALLTWFFRWRHGPERVSVDVGTGTDPADELRQKLDETRARSEPDPSRAPEGDLDARRREVHERGRSAVDEMQLPPPD